MSILKRCCASLDSMAFIDPKGSFAISSTMYNVLSILDKVICFNVQAVLPPSIEIAVPVICAAALDAKYAARLATSDGLVIRPVGLSE